MHQRAGQDALLQHEIAGQKQDVEGRDLIPQCLAGHDQTGLLHSVGLTIEREMVAVLVHSDGGGKLWRVAAFA